MDERNDRRDAESAEERRDNLSFAPLLYFASLREINFSQRTSFEF